MFVFECICNYYSILFTAIIHRTSGMFKQSQNQEHSLSELHNPLAHQHNVQTCGRACLDTRLRPSRHAVVQTCLSRSHITSCLHQLICIMSRQAAAPVQTPGRGRLDMCRLLKQVSGSFVQTCGHAHLDTRPRTSLDMPQQASTHPAHASLDERCM